MNKIEDAKIVILIPSSEDINIYCPSESLKALFCNKVISKGDIIIHEQSIIKHKLEFLKHIMKEKPDILSNEDIEKCHKADIEKKYFEEIEKRFSLQVFLTEPEGYVKIINDTELKLLSSWKDAYKFIHRDDVKNEVRKYMFGE